MISDGPRAARFGAPRRVARDGVDTALRSRVRALRADVATILEVDVDALAPVDPRTMFTPAHVADLSRICVGRASAWAVTGEGPVASVLALALDLEELAMDLECDAIADRSHRLSECAIGLARLRTIPSTPDLLLAASQEVVARCGFGRAVVSRVESGAWVPMTAHFGAADGAWFGAFAGQSIPLHGYTPEARMLTERLPAVVMDTSQGAVHEEIIVEAGQSKSYVVAPLLIDGRVVGFIHADHYADGQQADEVDRDVLCSFAMGLARTHERLVLMERIRAQRAKVDAVLGSALQRADEAGGLDVMSTGGQLLATRPDVVADLTARERDVLSLIVDGATNQEIARRLIIAPDTVKCHVKQILRKFGVANRAQVIACAAGTALI
jgi:DNA-binding CsgD family transcriptional regulator